MFSRLIKNLTGFMQIHKLCVFMRLTSNVCHFDLVLINDNELNVKVIDCAYKRYYKRSMKKKHF